nr:hypothetical protein CFP56_71136 [Quercus suber]
MSEQDIMMHRSSSCASISLACSTSISTCTCFPGRLQSLWVMRTRTWTLDLILYKSLVSSVFSAQVLF